MVAYMFSLENLLFKYFFASPGIDLCYLNALPLSSAPSLFCFGREALSRLPMLALNSFRSLGRLYICDLASAS